ncbi:sensor histidine kinase [Chloroflexota bacterium]
MADQPGEAKEYPLSDIVHDLKTPIAAIKSYADLIEQFGELNERQLHFVGRIVQATEKMTTLVNDVIDLAWVEGNMELKPTLCNLSDIAKSEINALTEYAHEHEVRVVLVSAENLVPLHCDEHRIHQVFSNLLSNSIKYNRRGRDVRVHIARQDHELIVKIKDEGLGIAPTDIPHIFERFYRAPREEASPIEGTGLGLSIVKAIIERHNGTIGVDTELEMGSTFWFTLPLAQNT